jgi:hypothetical protein
MSPYPQQSNYHPVNHELTISLGATRQRPEAAPRLRITARRSASGIGVVARSSQRRVEPSVILGVEDLVFVEQWDSPAVVYLCCDRNVVVVTEINQLAAAGAVGKRRQCVGGNRPPGGGGGLRLW